MRPISAQMYTEHNSLEQFGPGPIYAIGVPFFTLHALLENSLGKYFSSCG